MGVEATKAGTWRARWRDDSGRQMAKTFKRKADATAFLHATLADLHRGTYVSPAKRGGITLEAWADEWLAAAMNLGPGGRETYRRDLDRHILPALGDYPLGKLTPTAIDRYLADELAAGVAPSSVHRHYRTVRRCLQVAIERGRLAKNPCDLVKPPRVEQAEMRFLTVDQVDALSAAVPARYRAWVLVAAWGGLRWSETVGLRRDHVDGRRLLVTEQLIRRADGAWYREPPKTRAGRRTVTLPDSVAADLEQHLVEYSGPGPDDLVFANAHGRPMNRPSFAGNVWKPALASASIAPGLRIHDLRHTAVALAILSGAHPKTIQARMGHATIGVTLDRYGHLFPEMDGGLADDLDRLRRPPPDSGPPEPS